MSGKVTVEAYMAFLDRIEAGMTEDEKMAFHMGAYPADPRSRLRPLADGLARLAADPVPEKK